VTGSGPVGAIVPRERLLGIVGAGGHAVSIASTARSAGWQVAFMVDPLRVGTYLANCPVVASVPAHFLSSGGRLVVAIGDNYVRSTVARELIETYGLGAFTPVIDPTAACADSAVIGAGAFVGRGSVVGASARVGAFSIVNSGAVLEHESVMDDYSSLGPGVTVGGCVRLGTMSAVGIGTTVRHSVCIGAHTVIGAHSYVHADVEDLVVAWGVPAKVHRRRRQGDCYL
jgi:sugar O-acyltransferase (sialic acid O-acetyltransferase NeuD family)